MPTYRIEGIDVEFPHEAYPCQIEYMRKVILALEQEEHALLESPTGTGKTLCLLCATLAWREAYAKRTPARPPVLGGPPAGPPPVVYASRTHSQLAQVVRELRSTSYRVRTTVLGSRQQMCLHPRVSKMAAAQGNFACRGLVRHRQCSWHNKQRLERVVQDLATPSAAGAAAAAAAQTAPGGGGGGGGAFGVGKGAQQQQGQQQQQQQPAAAAYEPPDIEDLMRAGRTAQVCPYFLSRDLAPHCDVIFAPYNYLLDASTARQLDGLRLDGAIVILDEAHNVGDAAKGAASFDLTAQQRAAAIDDLDRAIALCEQRLGRGEGGGGLFDEGAAGSSDLMARLEMGRNVLLELERSISALAVPAEGGLVRPGEALLELLAGVNVTPETAPLFRDMLQDAAQALTDEELGSGRAGGARVASSGVDALLAALDTVFASRQPLWRDGPPASRGYRLYVHREGSDSGRGGGRGGGGRGGGGFGGDGFGGGGNFRGNAALSAALDAGSAAAAPTLSYWCFAPGVAVHRLLGRGARSLLLTSGTLAPLDGFAAELGVGFAHVLEGPHVVGPDQVWVGVAPSGPTGARLNSSYATRGSDAYRADLGNLLVNVARVVPDGLLVFFPSYSVMASAIEHWKSPGAHGGQAIWDRISRHKAPVVEPRDAASFPAAIAEFRARLDDPSGAGAVLFAVCRGKVSEGLDFSDRAGRAVVITGIPFGATHDPSVRLQRQVLDEELRAGAAGLSRGRGVSGEAWYVQQAARAVNQAMGRVVRHRWDYGAVLLADERFLVPQNQRQLSKWLRSHVVEHPSFGGALASLTKFFKDKAGFEPPPEAARARQQRDAAQLRAAAARISAFEMLGSGGGGRAPRPGVGAAATAGPPPLLAPRAIDVSGFATIADADAAAATAARRPPQPAGRLGGGASGSGGGGGGSGTARSASVGAGGAAGGSAAGGAADDWLSLARASIDSATSSGATGGGAGAGAAARGRPGGVAMPGAGARLGGPPGGSRLGGAAQPPPAPRRPQIDASAGCALGGGGGGGGGGNNAGEEASPAVQVVGPAHLVRRHGQPGAPRAVDSDNDAAADEAPPGPDEGAATADDGAAAAAAPGAGPTAGRKEPAPGGATVSGAAAPQAEAGAAAANANADADADGGPAPDPRAFLARLQRELGAAEFGAVRALLAAYREARDVTALIEGLIAALRAPSTCHLLAGFAAFVPRRDREWYCAAVAEHFRAAAAAGGAGGGRGDQPAAQAQPRPGAERRPPARPEAPKRPAGPGDPAAATAAAAAAAKKPRQLPAALAPGAFATSAAAALLPRQQHPQQQRPQQQQQQQQQQQPGRPSAQPLPALGRAALAPVRPADSGAKVGVAAAASTKPIAPGGANAAALNDRQQPRDRAAQPPPTGAAPQRPSVLGSLLTAAPPPPQAGRAAALGPRQRPAQPPDARAGAGPKPCALCKRTPMEAAHRAPCGHLGCHGCWLQLLARSMRAAQCPTCARELRRSQLVAAPFA